MEATTSVPSARRLQRAAMFLYRPPSGRGCSVQDHSAGHAFPCGAGERIGRVSSEPLCGAVDAEHGAPTETRGSPAHDSEHEDDPGCDEGALHQARGDVAEREDFVLPPQDRVDHEGCSDVGDDEQQLEERAGEDLAVPAATGDVRDRVVEGRRLQAGLPFQSPRLTTIVAEWSRNRLFFAGCVGASGIDWRCRVLFPFSTSTDRRDNLTMASSELSRSVLPIPDRQHLGLTTYDAKDPDTSFPPIEPLLPPEGAPNVLVVLLDDVGFGAASAFGGPAQMPTAERLQARRADLQPVPHHGAVRADPGGAAQRPQPPLGRDGHDHRDRDVGARGRAGCVRTRRRRWRRR